MTPIEFDERGRRRRRCDFERIHEIRPQRQRVNSLLVRLTTTNEVPPTPLEKRQRSNSYRDVSTALVVGIPYESTVAFCCSGCDGCGGCGGCDGGESGGASMGIRDR